MEVQTFLLQILQYKNNPQITISRNLCPDLISLYAIMRYVFLRGFVGEYQLYDTIEGLFSNVKLTDDGIKYILGRNSETMFNCSINVPLQINANFQLGGINIA